MCCAWLGVCVCLVFCVVLSCLFFSACVVLCVALLLLFDVVSRAYPTKRNHKHQDPNNQKLITKPVFVRFFFRFVVLLFVSPFCVLLVFVVFICVLCVCVCVCCVFCLCG